MRVFDPQARNHAADKHGWIEAGLVHHPAGHGRGGGLAVGTGDRNGAVALHQGGKRIRAVEHRKTQLARRLKLGIAIFDGSGNHHRLGALQIGRVVRCKDLDALGAKAAKIRSVFLVASLDGKPTRRHNFGYGTHADAANANNMNATAGKRICHGRVLSSPVRLPPKAVSPPRISSRFLSSYAALKAGTCLSASSSRSFARFSTALIICERKGLLGRAHEPARVLEKLAHLDG